MPPGPLPPWHWKRQSNPSTHRGVRSKHRADHRLDDSADLRANERYEEISGQPSGLLIRPPRRFPPLRSAVVRTVTPMSVTAKVETKGDIAKDEPVDADVPAPGGGSAIEVATAVPESAAGAAPGTGPIGAVGAADGQRSSAAVAAAPRSSKTDPNLPSSSASASATRCGADTVGASEVATHGFVSMSELQPQDQWRYIAYAEQFGSFPMPCHGSDSESE